MSKRTIPQCVVVIFLALSVSLSSSSSKAILSPLVAWPAALWAAAIVIEGTLIIPGFVELVTEDGPKPQWARTNGISEWIGEHKVWAGLFGLVLLPDDSGRPSFSPITPELAARLHLRTQDPKVQQIIEAFNQDIDCLNPLFDEGQAKNAEFIKTHFKTDDLSPSEQAQAMAYAKQVLADQIRTAGSSNCPVSPTSFALAKLLIQSSVSPTADVK